MVRLLDLVYLIVLVILFPWLLYKALTTGKYRRGLGAKFFGTRQRLAVPAPVAEENGTRSSRPTVVWFHGVSVGEIHLLRQVVAGFRRRHPRCLCVISTTTDTGHDEACKRFPDLPVIYWPFDFSWAVRRTLDAVKPDLVVLAEGEIWPSFLSAAKDRDLPVAIINGRVSPRSLGRYRFLGRLVRPILGRLELVAAQTEEYAASFRALGVAPGRIHVTGSVKYDGVEVDRGNPRTEELRRLFGLKGDELVWIAGSTQSPEEVTALQIFQRTRKAFPQLRLILVPRQRERFDEVAGMLQQSGEPFIRRSQLDGTARPRNEVILVDTIGELGAVWGLADVAYVGGSLDGKRGGQNMIEPAAYGAAVVFGPNVWNFRETVTRLMEVGGAIQVADAAGLESAVGNLLASPEERSQIGQAARRFVLSQGGATERTLDLLNLLLPAIDRFAPVRQAS